ncbi:hypothetical protein F5887DRAFT_1192316 [Amanita rubescens]|nr:hypothetical protein F5887DRAFT_1192316 [Amanita rubescens]
MSMYFDLVDLPLSQRMSQIFISVGNTKRSNRPQLDSIEREEPTINCSSDHPWISILADYGLDKSEVEATLTTGSTSERHNDEGQVQCLRIYAAGTSRDTFEFLDYGLWKTLRELVSFEKPIQEGNPVKLYLQDLMEFGSAAKVNHVVRENKFTM